MDQVFKQTLIDRFKSKDKHKPYRSLLKAFHDEIMDMEKKGFNSVEIKSRIEGDIGEPIETKNFQQALLVYKKALQKNPQERDRSSPSPLSAKKDIAPSEKKDQKKKEKFDFDLKSDDEDQVTNLFKTVKKPKK